VIPPTDDYDALVSKLKTGDLLYIRSKKGNVSHVIMWVGPIGQSPDSQPLIIDSHGEGVKDCNDKSIPPGIWLRPFGRKSWYFNSLDRVHRIVQ